MLGTTSVQRTSLQVGESLRAPPAGWLVLAALATAVAAQGAFYARGQIAVGALLIAAAVAAPAAYWRSPVPTPLLWSFGSMLVWIPVSGAVAGAAFAGLREAVFVAALATLLQLCRGLDRQGHDLLLGGLIVVGAAAAVVGWAGIALHASPWGLSTDGLWRAASTMTYANATAAALVPIALVTVSLLETRGRSTQLALAAMVLVTGIGATLSRAAVLALVVGMMVLVALRGRRVVTAAIAPAAGAAVALIGLMASMPAYAASEPVAAVVAAALGGTVTVFIHRRRGRGRAGLWAIAAVVCIGTVAVASPVVRHAAERAWQVRATTDSPSRLHGTTEGVRIVASHPVAGVGPGGAQITSRAADGHVQVQQYIHNEYLQTAVETGLIGAGLLLAVLAGLAQLLRRARPGRGGDALWAGVVAGCAAFALQSGFDFIWHVPAAPLIVAALIGLATHNHPEHAHKERRAP